MKTTPPTPRLGALAVALAVTFSLALPVWAQDASAAKSFADMVQAVTLVPAGKHSSEMLDKVSQAVNFIKRMDLPKAQLSVNEALQLDPRNAHLHFLNGFVYHLQARQGETQKAELALEGYQQALRIDPGNWIAQEFLGLAYIDLKQFNNARISFSETLLLTPESSVSVYGLMVASYLTGDAKTACAMADQFRKISAEPPQGFLRSSIAVYASCGSFDQARGMRTLLVQRGAGGAEVERINQRLEQWKAFYEKQARNAAGLVKTSLAQAPDNSRPEVFAKASKPSNSPVASPTEVSVVSQTEPQAEEPIPVVSEERAPSTDASAGGLRMLMVDVVLLSTQEVATTSKGVNLLSALTLQLGSGSGDSFNPFYSRSFSSETGSSSITSITRAVTIPSLTYSLNIANANDTVNEVLARPTLAAIEGMPSEFFSGTNLSAGLVSVSEQGGTTIVPLEKRFGIKLGVTPKFLPQGQVQLKVEAQRTALNASAANPRAAYQLEIGETTANANVVMNMGETLVLSGLSEKASSRSRDGVPGLQGLPGIQYLFSNKKTANLQRSVLILVTPRTPVQINESGAGESMAIRMKALRERFGFADTTPANIEAVFAQLQSNKYFREFRQGDVSLERWDRMQTTGERLKEALGFLYY